MLRRKLLGAALVAVSASAAARPVLAQATVGRAGDLSPQDRLRLYARGLYFTVDKADDVLDEFA